MINDTESYIFTQNVSYECHYALYKSDQYQIPSIINLQSHDFRRTHIAPNFKQHALIELQLISGQLEH